MDKNILKKLADDLELSTSDTQIPEKIVDPIPFLEVIVEAINQPSTRGAMSAKLQGDQIFIETPMAGSLTLKVAANPKQAMQKKAYLLDYAELKDKQSFHDAVKAELDSTYGAPCEVIESLPEKTKAKREELLTAINAMPDSAFPLVEPGKNDAYTDMPTLWWESSDIWDLMEEGDFSDFESVIDEFINWVKAQK